ncbi:MAG: hypothetical protein HQK53_12345 [Oligoflexia bacterium]|nr:hypothetical protein [Oligoflexia bacterium]
MTIQIKQIKQFKQFYQWNSRRKYLLVAVLLFLFMFLINFMFCKEFLRVEKNAIESRVALPLVRPVPAYEFNLHEYVRVRVPIIIFVGAGEVGGGGGAGASATEQTLGNRYLPITIFDKKNKLLVKKAWIRAEDLGAQAQAQAQAQIQTQANSQNQASGQLGVNVLQMYIPKTDIKQLLQLSAEDYWKGVPFSDSLTDDLSDLDLTTKTAQTAKEDDFEIF